MNRRHFLVVVGLGSIAASTAAAAPFEDAVVAQLESQGYSSITVERTLLGRVKIIGQIDGGRREIILNPRTGEILRDLWSAKSGKSDGPKIQRSPDNSGSGGGTNGGDDGDDDDDDNIDGDDDDDDDSDSNDSGSNSGEGGGS